MQSSSTTTSSRKPAKSKPPAKARATAKSPPTLHLKEKHTAPASVSDLTSMIATMAYLRAEQRGFEPGHELEDWLHAEKQVRLSLS